MEGKHQTATRVSRSLVASMQKAKANPLAWLGPFQDAKQPEVGQSFAPTPPVPPVIPCYRRELPLHFKVLIADQALSFVCDTYVAPPKPDPVGLITIPVQKVYLTMNEVRLFKVTGNVELPVIALSLNIDMDSWSWGFSATLPGDTLPLLWTGASNSPVSLEAKVNGQSYYLLAEKVSRSRSHGKTSISVSGRGHSAWLSSPYAPSMSFTSGEGVTAQHLMNDALKTNGVSIGWDIDWGILDWYVPGGVWSTTGSYIDAVTNIARSVGAYVSPHKTLQKLAIKARYPALPWTWASATPDIILPADVVSTESVQWSEKPSYDSVYVSGVSDGVLGFVKRAGTAGDMNAPMVTDALITHADAARMRGAAILADTGIVSTISLSLPVLALTGVIEPGKLIRYTEGARSTLGLTKSVSVSMTEQSKLSQTIELEVHG